MQEAAVPTIGYGGFRQKPSPDGPLHGGCVGGCLGAFLLGVVIPLALAAYGVVVYHDPGGPLFWPIVCLSGGVVGLVIGSVAGSVVHVVFRRRDSGGP